MVLSLLPFVCHTIKQLLITFAFQIVTISHWLKTGSAMMRQTMLTAIMMVEIAVELAHQWANVPNVPVLVELMILVTVSPIVSSILKMGSILVFATKSFHPWKSWEGPGTEWDRTGLARDPPELFLKFPGLPWYFFLLLSSLVFGPIMVHKYLSQNWDSDNLFEDA